MRESFIFYRSYMEALRTLPAEQRLNLMDALIAYALDGSEVSLDGVEKGMFALIRPQLDANQQRYENGCKGAKYGRRGGRPKNEKTQENPDGDINKNPYGDKGKKGKGDSGKNPIGDNNKNPKGVISENPKQTPNVNENVNVNETTVVVNARTRAREVFAETYAIIDDAVPTIDGIDWNKLSVAYLESKTFLQNRPFAKCMSWIIKHYDEIVMGKYKDKTQVDVRPLSEHEKMSEEAMMARIIVCSDEMVTTE